MNTMTPEQMKERLHALLSAYNSGSMIDEIDKWYSADVVSHPYDGSTVRGLEAFKKTMASTMASFTNVNLTLGDVVVEGSREAHAYSYTATFSGPFGGFKPTGKKISVRNNVCFQTWRDGKIAEIWWMDNAMALIGQVSPTPPSPQ